MPYWPESYSCALFVGVTLRSLRYRLQKHALGDDAPDDDEPPSESKVEAARES